MRIRLMTLMIVLLGTNAFAQTGTIGNPFTTLDQAVTVTTAGTYYFNLGGTTFDTYVDGNGYVQVAIDFGNGVGVLPQGTSLTAATRGILSPTALASLTGIEEVRISSSTGNMDAITTNATIISKVQSNTTIHGGLADNTANSEWTGTGAANLTAAAGGNTSLGMQLQNNIAHISGNGAGMYWAPVNSAQYEYFNAGEVGPSESLHIWVRGSTAAGAVGNPFTSLLDASNVTTAGIYFFNLGGTTFDTYVDGNGYVQVAIDFGNGVGAIPQGTSLTSATRGILSPTALSSLTEASEVRVSSSTGNMDATTTNATIISKVQSNTTIHGGLADNTANSEWTGTGAANLTAAASGNTSLGMQLQNNVAHISGNGAGMYWAPVNSAQYEYFNAGEVGPSESLQVWVRATAVLPVELKSFTTELLGNSEVKLVWQTTSEINNDYFSIERSIDGTSWEHVNDVNGMGNSSTHTDYVSIDKNPYKGVSYYRLKQIDFDGQYSYSVVRTVNNLDIEPSSVSVFPNPVQDFAIINGDNNELGAIRIYSFEGQDITGLVRIDSTSERSATLDLSNLQSGFYIIRTATTVNKVFKQ